MGAGHTTSNPEVPRFTCRVAAAEAEQVRFEPLGFRMPHQITVKVAGCVAEHGDHALPVGASVGDAISAAKGFSKRPYSPASH